MLLFAAVVLTLNDVLNACVFMKSSESALSKRYTFQNTNRDACLETCYSDQACTYVKHDQTTCDIYSERNKGTNVKDGYRIDRKRNVTNNPLCSSSVSFAPAIEFQRPSGAGAMNISGPCPNVPFTNIYRFKAVDSNVYMYSNQKDFQNEATLTRQCGMSFYSQNPDGMDLTPVFTRNNLQLLFGEAYNVTGYTFLDAYAVPRLYYLPGGSLCLSNEPIREYRMAGDVSYKYLSSKGGNMVDSDMMHTFYILSSSCWD
ncbi:hypothetical protein Y032_0550g3299 [Ancylostoma ceylanicum]|nr:hypothetical protein Y032_0550g3299 [Ancylostoma ceylanicum]